MRDSAGGTCFRCVEDLHLETLAECAERRFQLRNLLRQHLWKMRYWVDLKGAALWRRTSGHIAEQVFSLRCTACGRWTWGCGRHWLCGVCERCREHLEE